MGDDENPLPLPRFFRIGKNGGAQRHYLHTLSAWASPRRFDWAGRPIPTSEPIQVSQNRLRPNSEFSSNFANFILKILENLKFLANIPKISFKNRDFRGTFPRNFEPRGRVSPLPRGDAHAYHTSFSPKVGQRMSH